MPEDFDIVRGVIDAGSPAVAAFDYLIAHAYAAGFVPLPKLSQVRSIELQWRDRRQNPFSAQVSSGHVNFYLRRPALNLDTDLFDAAVATFGPVKPNRLGEYRTRLQTVEHVDAMLAFLRKRGAWPSSRSDRRFIAATYQPVTGEHFLRAARRLAEGFKDHPYGPSTDYDLLFDGGRLPPKAVFGLAATEALGFPVRPENFSAGEGMVCFRMLRANGYEIVAKGEASTRDAGRVGDEAHARAEGEPSSIPGRAEFARSFERFQSLVRAKSGHPFRGFDEGLAAAWEQYKPRLRAMALERLGSGDWSEDEIGTGRILARTIDAIEIQGGPGQLTNNLVFWQNRYGHANRDHRSLLEAVRSPKLRGEIEAVLFALYRGAGAPGHIFDRLSALSGGKYPLLAYLYFLKDMDRFMPIQPTGFDRAFRALGVEFETLRQCSWENYTAFNALLGALAPLIADVAELKHVRLIDAHSFCWILSTLLKQEAEGTLAPAAGSAGPGRVIAGREKSILAMRYSVESTVRNANGQVVGRVLKNKELRMSAQELEALIASLLDIQEDRCALTGIRFHFHGPQADRNLLPSLDRIDSDGHYEAGNLQIVCQFVNFWKGAANNDEFRRLLMLVRGAEAD